MSACVPTFHSLNLSPRYAPNWGVWDIAREIISNAIDADPDHYEVNDSGPNCLYVRTSTAPSLAELFVIGEGSKSEGGTTIGQFGEGFKLAALTITRIKGGSIKVRLPDCTIEFAFMPTHGVDVLHAQVIHEPNPVEGMEVELNAPGVAVSYKSKILEDRTPGPRIKNSTGCKIYVKGIWINTFNLATVFDWNLHDLRINRDRAFAATTDIESAIRSWLASHCTAEVARALIDAPESFECDECLQYCGSWADKLCARLTDAFIGQYGESAVKARTDATGNVVAEAQRLGYQVVHVGKGLYECLKVKCVNDVCRASSNLEFIDASKYSESIKKLRRLDAVVGAPNVSVRVFANRRETLRGVACFADNYIALNETVLGESFGAQAAVYLHEMAHMMSGADDCTPEFEWAMTQMLGRMANLMAEVQA